MTDIGVICRTELPVWVRAEDESAVKYPSEYAAEFVLYVANCRTKAVVEFVIVTKPVDCEKLAEKVPAAPDAFIATAIADSIVELLYDPGIIDAVYEVDPCIK